MESVASYDIEFILWFPGMVAAQSVPGTELRTKSMKYGFFVLSLLFSLSIPYSYGELLPINIIANYPLLVIAFLLTPMWCPEEADSVIFMKHNQFVCGMLVLII